MPVLPLRNETTYPLCLIADSGFRGGLAHVCYTHCAPLERGCWTYHDSIDISLLWSERWKSGGLIRYFPQEHRPIPAPSGKYLSV